MQGMKRGLFSNEAGEGSAPNAAAIAHTSHPVKQGLLQALGVFTDTIVVCTCTAFIILLSGIYDSGRDGIILTKYALETHIGPAGGLFITAAIFFFAYSTIIANYFYGETNIRFITSKKSYVNIFRIVTAATVMAGALISLQEAWSIVDLAMGIMTLHHPALAQSVLPPQRLHEAAQARARPCVQQGDDERGKRGCRVLVRWLLTPGHSAPRSERYSAVSPNAKSV